MDEKVKSISLDKLVEADQNVYEFTNAAVTRARQLGQLVFNIEEAAAMDQKSRKESENKKGDELDFPAEPYDTTFALEKAGCEEVLTHGGKIVSAALDEMLNKKFEYRLAKK